MIERLRSVEVEMKNVGSVTSKLQLLLPRIEMDRLLLKKLVQAV